MAFTIETGSALDKYLPTNEKGFWLNEVVKPDYKVWASLANAEIREMEKEANEAIERANAALHRKRFLEGLYLVKAGKAEIRARRMGATYGVLAIYLRNSDSPTGVSMLVSVPDTEEARTEIHKYEITIYASAS